MTRRVDFAQVDRAAMVSLVVLLNCWLPGGKVRGHEYVVLNPTRKDRSLGSFKINVRTGRWADFATGDAGGDPISLAAYLFGMSQLDAARKLAEMLDISE